MTPNLGRAAAQFAIIGGLLVVACLFGAHDDTWTTAVALLVALVAVLLLRRIGRGGRARLGLAFLTCLLVAGSGTSLVKTAWIGVVGTTSTVTVAGSDTYCTGRNTCSRHEEYTLALPGGGTVDGKLRGYRPGALQAGDRLDVRYDPTGLVRDPRPAAADLGVSTLLAAVGLLAGLALLVGLLLTAGRPPREASEPSPWQASVPRSGS